MYSILILSTKIHFTQDLLEETSYFCYIATRFVIKINIKQENECRERSSNLWRVVLVVFVDTRLLHSVQH